MLKIKLTGAALLLLALYSCVDFPSEFKPPVWDVVLNLPIADSSYTLLEAVENDSTNLRYNVSEDDPNLIYYVNEAETIDTIKVSDNLTIDDFNASFTQDIGSVTLNDIDPVKADIFVEDWTNEVATGSTQIFPPTEGEANIGFQRFEAFSNVTLEAGKMNLTVENRLPVEIELRGFTIRNAEDGSVVATDSRVRKIPPAESTNMKMDLAGAYITDSLEYSGTIRSEGSGLELVTVPENAGTEVTATFDSLLIQRALAPLPAQAPFTKDSTFTIDDSTYIQRAVFGKGNFLMTFINYFDVDIIADISILNLKNENGIPYSETVYIQRNEQTISPAEPVGLEGWRIEPVTPGALTNKLRYQVEVNTIETDSLRELNVNDSLVVLVSYFDMALRSVTGKLEPTEFEIEENSFSFDYGKADSVFSYKNINFGDPNIRMRLKSTADMPLKLDGSLVGLNGKTSEDMQLQDILIPAGAEETVINLNNYGLKEMINSFSGALPDSFVLSGNTVVNPYYETGRVTSQDYVTGNIDVEFPLDVGIDGGLIIDTVDIDFGDVDTADINRVNYGQIIIELENSIPASLSFTATVIDSLGNTLLLLPPRPLEPDNYESIQVQPPEVDNEGNVVAAATAIQELELFGSEIKDLTGKNKKMVIRLEIETPPAGATSPVKFRTTDFIRYKVYATASYKFDYELED